MNFSVNEAFPNYSGGIGGNGNITVRGGAVDPVEIPVEPGSGGAITCPFFEIVSSPQSYHTVPSGGPSASDAWVKIGTVNNVLPSNISKKISGNANQTVMVYLECTLSQSGSGIGPSSVTIKTASNSVPLYGSWPDENLRPEKVNIPLGFIIGTTDDDGFPVYSITSHRGDIVIGEQADWSDYLQSASSVGASFSNSIYYERIT